MIEAGSPFAIDFVAVVLGALVVGMVAEMFWPARDNQVSALRWLNNGVLALITYASIHLLGTALALYILHEFEPRNTFALAGGPLWLDLALTFIALEAVRYSLHIAMHKVPILWRFHSVHHSDSEVDIATSFRHHPIEGLINAIPVTVLVWVLASAPEVLLIYRAWDLLMAVFTHCNVRVPFRVEHWLRWLVVTPTFHRTHHLAEKRFTDSNYSSTIPWLDYLFSTYQPTTPEQQEKSIIGLDTHTPHEQRIDGMLLAPFLER
jgi:sterol desaturase/sphingolipid hydroxylase (fatty acid hydroxylase superfamily)